MLYNATMMDESNGYEKKAPAFIQVRGQNTDGVGTTAVRKWARALPQNATVLDIGCGTGIPVSKVLVDEGLTVYGIDASPTLVEAFRRNLPNAYVACESVENSPFFNRKFDAVISWGLIFLLSKKAQGDMIKKVSNGLRSGGKFLFTAPFDKAVWKDILTGQLSTSLGAKQYSALLSSSGLFLRKEFEDEGQNYYYSAVKI